MTRLYGKIKGGRVVITDRPHKFGARQIQLDGHTFDSVLEADRYKQLKVLAKAGAIKDLVLKPFYDIEIGGHKICRYYADFGYIDAGGRVRVEDTKGVRTPVFMLKRKLVEACYGIKIEVVRAASHRR
ncbi:MAG TPA: DUF1064 domain-containing protein [Candidatus Acidoferrales bacterium]|nr:DUF1064 domain-containing protein [Candidatus Acidoferrales bacterium]